MYKMLEKQAKDSTTDTRNSSTHNRKAVFNERHKAANPLLEQVHYKAEQLQIVFNKAGQKVANEASAVKNTLTSFHINDVMQRPIDNSIESNHLTIPQSDLSDVLTSSSSRSSTPELEQYKATSLIDFDTDENPLLPTPIVLDVITTPLISETARQSPQIDSKIRQLQNELQYKVQTFDNKRLDPREAYGEEQKEIKKLVQQFDPFDESNAILFRSEISNSDRHPSLNETIPTNCVNNVLRNIQSTYGTNTRMNLKATNPVQQVSYSSDFDPLVPLTNDLSSQLPSSEANGSNLIDFN